MKTFPLAVLLICALGFGGLTQAHDIAGGGEHPHYDWSVKPPEVVPDWFFAQADAGPQRVRVVAQAGGAMRPAQATVFELFAPRVSVHWDERYLYVEHNGMPAHNMMVGITNWQQQVPLPQNYTGANAWRIPLAPVPSKMPVSIKGRFLRGAIAIAANGIPIFNPQNNRGEVSAEIGELDQWGGHCGRADDYHYHAAPLHLQSVVGKDKPIAYALDGYPIYGLTEPDGSQPAGLDTFNGHTTAALGYHYHASTKYPYVNGGFHGEVVEAGGQVDPQPNAQPVRSAGAPLRGAKITGFETSGDSYKLTYEVNGEKRAIAYSIKADGTYPFEFQNGSAGTTTEVYTRRQRGGGPGEGGGPREGGPRDATRPPGGERAPARESSEARPAVAPVPPVASVGNSSGFTLRSPEVANGGALPVDYTGDGSGATLPLEWSGAPAGTQGYALVMHHLDPEGVTKWYWILYNIPASVTSLPKNVKGIGTLGTGFKGQIGYEPPHSKGPGAKTYVLTVYALSAAPEIKVAPAQVNYEVMMAGMKGKILASSDLSVVYDRTGKTSAGDKPGPDQGGPGGEPRNPRKEGSDGPPPQAGPGAEPGGQRKPWMQMHGAELDANTDGVITMAEMTDDLNRAFAIYDRNKDGVITAAEREAAGDVREGAAFAGFIYRHLAELDANGDGSLSREELAAAAKMIFDIADQDHDGKVTKAEWESSPQAPLRKRGGGPPPPEGGAAQGPPARPADAAPSGTPRNPL